MCHHNALFCFVFSGFRATNSIKPFLSLDLQLVRRDLEIRVVAMNFKVSHQIPLYFFLIPQNPSMWPSGIGAHLGRNKL